ncbi:ABC transporter permease [Janthinobacterium agaricidamnosum]|uniref:Branched-chain amino acid transport system / permease component family protein n=1 Tax=Janthinobacterium agaricidamnosum NBRC 102515 = DSM 9628 TaxID=1349767 RepID=W0VC21_9BURK|nr:ABC transporter permease [Janthinobacterium agaricidamnosum]CDG84852.1 branched-chain amino acid transport system / permease component family protein [Janthinobacterium agaricidamnosum NBRC 102515 = DSM 9628]
MIKLEARAAPSALMAWLSPLLAIMLTVLCGALLFIALGKDPLAGLAVFFIEPLRGVQGWAELGLKVAPLLLVSVGLVICLRAHVYNIGAEGQLVLGAIAGGATGLYLDGIGASGAGPMTLVLLAGMLGGMVWAGITAFLRDRYHASEILVSLMLVYIGQLLLSYLVYGVLKDPDGFNFPQSKLLSDAMLLPIVISGTRLHLGIVLALLAALGGWLFLSKSVSGFRLRVGGMAPAAARYAGFSSRKALWTSLLACGALSGLAGVCEVAGPLGQLTPSVSPGYGFAAIIVAFVGRLHPVGVIFSSIVMALFYIGGELAQSRLGMPSAITGVFQGILLFALLGCDVLIQYKLRWRK